GSIDGFERVCPDNQSTYRNINSETGGTLFNWTLNDNPIGDINSDSISIIWETVGTYQLCLQVANACDEAPRVCKTIVVEAIPEAQLIEVICENECFTLADTTLCESGIYPFTLQNALGCDSSVLLNLTVLESPLTNLDLIICEGDSIRIGNQFYSNDGQFVEIVQTDIGCDSTINLDLAIIVCEIQGNSTTTPVACFGEASGSLQFSVGNGTPPFAYRYERVGGDPSGMGMLTDLNMNQTIDGLPAGIYTIFVEDDFANDLVLIAEITTPSPLRLNLEASDYNGVNVTCADANDGTLFANVQGGTMPYAYAWDGGATSAQIAELSVGNYSILVTDAAGCQIQSTTTLNAPPPFELELSFINPSCDDFATGQIVINGTQGGNAPYLYSLDSAPFTTITNYDTLLEGNYTLTVMDINGCTSSQSGSLVAPQIPIIDLGADTTIQLAEPIRLHAFSSVVPDSIIWSNSMDLSCDDCLNPIATPVESQMYRLSVASMDGCFRSDSITITVNKVRNVYIPNAFSPNNDGVNDQFTVYGGPDVTRVKCLRIFNRWGAIVYELHNFPANIQQVGWDGMFKGQSVEQNVYTYFAEVEFIDGVTLPYQGDVTVIN
ncbi:MAG: gliding motility-associated C-terminal domain-containing protein, partial [Bacteroidota bacterium]